MKDAYKIQVETWKEQIEQPSISKVSSLLAGSGNVAKILWNTIYCSHRISRLSGPLEKDVLV